MNKFTLIFLTFLIAHIASKGLKSKSNSKQIDRYAVDLVNSGNVSQAAVIANDGSVISASDGFKVSSTEAQDLLNCKKINQIFLKF